MKLYIILTAFIVFAFFSNDFGLVDIQKTAVILAAGVDKDGDTFTLSTQIAVPQGSTSGGAATSTVTVDAKGSTVSECISKIFSETGWVPKLVFCDLVILGEQAAKDNAIACFDFFLRNEYMPDSAQIAVCEGTAKELLTSTSAMDDSPTQAIQKLLTQSAQSSGKVMANTLKQFAISYYGVSASGYAPYLRTTEQESSTPGGGSAGDAGGSAGSSEGTGAPEKKAVVYNAEQTALFTKGKMTGLLEREETFAFSLTKGKVFAGTFTAEEKGKPVSISILENKGGVSLDTKNNPKAELKVGLKLRLFNRGVPAPVNDIAEVTMSDELLENAETVIRSYLDRLVAACKKANCDLFQLKTQLYRSSLSRYEEWKDLVPNAIDTTIHTNVEKIK